MPPLIFNGIIHSDVLIENTKILRQEISELLAKNTIIIVPPVDWMWSLYNHFFFVLKRNGGIRPILEPETPEWSSQVSSISHAYTEAGYSPGMQHDWTAAIDLKDTM